MSGPLDAAAQDTFTDRFAQLQDLRSRPGSGAGTTGYNSYNSNSLRRPTGKKGQGAKASPRTGPMAQRQGVQANPNQAERANPRQNPKANETQQPRAAASSHAAYPVGALTDPPALASRRKLVPEDDPFVPTGVQAGAFLLRPAVELAGAYDTNPARTADGKPSWLAVVAPELMVNSNWWRHELTANLRGNYTSYEDASELNRPSVDAKVNARIDMTPWTRLDFESRFIVGTDNPGSPNIEAGLAKLPIFTTVGGSAGIGQRFNRFEAALKGGVDRTVYQDSRFTDGTTGSNADRDYDRYLAQLRLSYELTPGVKPFVEVGADTRVHDLEVDRNGVARDSDGWYLKGGTTFELSPVLTGDVAVGFINRTYQDPTLPDIRGATFDSSLVWVASALTTVKLIAKTTVDESTVVGVSGVFTREVALQVDHAFRRWLSATLRLSRATDDYVGSPREDERYAVSALMTYKLTREVWLKTEYRHEWLRSSEPGNNYVADVVLFGVRLQR